MRNRNRVVPLIRPAILIAIIFMAAAATPARAFEFKDGVWRLDAIIVRDPLLPMPSRGELERALSVAEEDISFKFNQKVKFRLLAGETTIGEYSSAVDKAMGIRLFFLMLSRREKNPLLYLKRDDKMLKHVEKSLSGDSLCWGDSVMFSFDTCGPSLEKMKRFLPPEERGREFTAAKVAERLSRNNLYWGNTFKNLLDVKGGLYFRNGGYPYNRFEKWMDFLRFTEGADLVITNTPVTGWQFWNSTPHISAGQGVIHGTVGFRMNQKENSPDWRPGASFLTVFPSHISMDPKWYARGTLLPGKKRIPDIINPGIHEKFTAGERTRYIGYIVAHETGHQLFEMPDTSSPAMKGCVMQRDYETLNDRYFFGLFKKRGPCVVETFAASVAEARQWARAGMKDKAMAIFKGLKKEYAGDDDAMYFIVNAMVRCGYKKESEAALNMLIAKAGTEKARSIYLNLLYELHNPSSERRYFP